MSTRRHALARLARAPLCALPAGLGLGPAGAQTPQRQPWPAGRALPPLVLPRLDGAPWSLAAQRGQVLVLNFWASWCEPCRAEMPSLELLAQRHEQHGLVVVAANFKETEATIRQFVAKASVDLPIVRDADGQAARALGVRMFPATVLFDRQGRPRYTVLGETEWQQAPARQWIDELV